MEENKKVKKAKEATEEKKLSYETLENAARQISMQADALFKENNRLKAEIAELSLNNLYAELNFRFKVLEYAHFFNEEFVDKCCEVIEHAMTPEEKKEEEVNNTEDGQQQD